MINLYDVNDARNNKVIPLLIDGVWATAGEREKARTDASRAMLQANELLIRGASLQIQNKMELFKTKEERELAVRVVQYVPGSISDMAPATLSMLQRFCRVLGVSEVLGDVLQNPLANAKTAAATASEIAAE